MESIRPSAAHRTAAGRTDRPLVSRAARGARARRTVPWQPGSVLLHFLELGVDDVVRSLLRAALRRAFRCTCRAGRTRLGLHVGVHLLAELLRDLAEFLDLRVDRRLVGRGVLQHVLERLDRCLDRFLLARVQLVAVLGQRLLRAVDQRVALVARIGQLTQLVIFRRVRFRVLDHLIDFRLGQTRVGLDRDLVFLAGRLVLRADVQDAVRVDVEGHFDLRHAARCGRDAFEVELAEQLVAGRHFAFALEHLDRHRALVVVRGRVDLRVLGRDRRVLADHLRHHAAERLDAERQRGHVEQQHVLAVARQHLTLDRRADGDGFVRVHVTARILAEELLHLLLHLRHAGLAADQDHVVDVRHLDAGVLDRDAARLDRALDQVLDQRFQLGAGDLQVQVLRARCVGRDVRQVDFGLLARRQLDLRLFGRFLQALQREHVLRQVDALLLLELADDVIDDALVEVLAAEERVAVGRQHFELHFAVDVRDLDDRHVEGTAAEVIHGDLAVALLGLVEAERERSRGRLVDDPLDFEARDAAGVLGRLALAVVEVRRHRDHGFRDRLAEVVFGRLLHLAQHFGRNLRRRELFAMRFDPGVAVVGLDDRVRHQADVLLDFLLFEAAADQALHREQRVLRVGHGLTLGRRADEHFVVVHVRDDRRRGARTFRVLDDLDLVAFHDGDARVRGAEVNTDDLSHFS
ncbi:putative NAD-specific glutamate dehydrogenase encoded in antisense gene pair with dnaKJ [Burkholderia sp. TJI49]|nr:putative NAD-specific glutamate dehydrogenase encoded in antisense gene pair with dnaKJ [Burkholderia sp. TJI49]